MRQKSGRRGRTKHPPLGFILLGSDDGVQTRVSTRHIVKYRPSGSGTLVHTVCDSVVVAETPQHIDALIDPSLVTEDLR